MDAFIPMFVPIPIRDIPDGARVKQELEFCESFLELILGHLGQNMGPEGQQSRLGRVLAGENPAEAERLVAEADQHFSSGRQHLALRILHAETGLGWDDLYQVADHWSALTTNQKERWVRFARLAKAVKSLNAAQHNG
jgi:hypothetical protein